MARTELTRRESLLAKANYLKIIAADLADSMKNGGFVSLYKGQGMEFAGVREYIRGDDVRAIDWNVTARMSRPYVKQFEETRELQLFIILDASESMHIFPAGRHRSQGTGSGKGGARGTVYGKSACTKYEAAAEAGAILALAAELNACPAGAVLFDGEIYFSCKPRLNKTQTMRLISVMDSPSSSRSTPPARGSALASAITGAGKLLASHSLVFIFSDFRVAQAEWEKPLISLAQKNRVFAFRMTDPQDYAFPSIGNALFTDAESGAKQELPTSSPEFRLQYTAYAQAHQNLWKNFCISHGITPVIFDTEKEPLGVLDAAFRQSPADSRRAR